MTPALAWPVLRRSLLVAVLPTAVEDGSKLLGAALWLRWVVLLAGDACRSR